MNLNQIITKYGDVLVMSASSFLQRENSVLNTNIPLYIYSVLDTQKCFDKIKNIFGECQTSYEDNTILAVPNTDFTQKDRFSFADLVEIIFRLRDPDGCMWDRAQNNMTIRTNAVEEAYELVEAVELNDNVKICEESGDVLLQGVFNAIIAEQENRFSLNDMITNLCIKLVTRHTHIFGKDKAYSKEDALVFWEKAKSTEKEQKSVNDKLNAVPATFSALLKANKVQKIIKKTGFDFPSVEEAVKKIYEEIDEFLQEDADQEKEGGDLLFSVVNVLRMLDIDPEIALMGTTNRFIRRFEYVVKKATEQNKKVEELSLDEMESYYQEYKKIENN
ncbi:MAG TPA: nucleoside triphosphate pyrophosphohydrolase [Clostridia bacterium]|nr:nucleoside triphosphate pyrophosphohydrolase [Clostridia bacterium]